ncbi:MAG: hypothetical protein M1837_005933 [Sclerophora amabilis]|nr:MAG: hypothetical protein M1837_005933 [Sclerophora amabilis]
MAAPSTAHQRDAITTYANANINTASAPENDIVTSPTSTPWPYLTETAPSKVGGGVASPPSDAALDQYPLDHPGPSTASIGSPSRHELQSNSHHLSSGPEKEAATAEPPRRERRNHHHHHQHHHHHHRPEMSQVTALGGPRVLQHGTVHHSSEASAVEYADHSYADSQWSSSSRDLDGLALRILVFLSLLCPLVSLVCFLWTGFTVLVLVLTWPLYAFCNTTPFGALIIRNLQPLHALQLRLVCSSPPFSVDDVDLTPPYVAHRLALLLIASPVLSVGVAVASWVCASFWLYNLILGNPDGKDRKNDGRAAVLAVRGWWVKALHNVFR